MIIQISDLNDGRYGRFGNQLFKYFFLKIIEAEIDCEIRYPEWLGMLALNLPKTPVPVEGGSVLVIDPSLNLSLDEVLSIIKEKIASGVFVIDLKGFFQFHSSEFLRFKKIFSDSVVINPMLMNQVVDAHRRIGWNNDGLVSVHVRRGDYLTHKDSPKFWIASMDSIEHTLKTIEQCSFRGKSVYVCSDDIDFCKQYFQEKEISIITADDLFKCDDDSLRLIIDFITMAIANVNVISNSSLSFFASMLNDSARVFLRPSPFANCFIPYDPWNSGVLLSK